MGQHFYRKGNITETFSFLKIRSNVVSGLPFFFIRRGGVGWNRVQYYWGNYWLIVSAPDDECGAVGVLGRGNLSTRRNPALLSLCTPQIPYYLARAPTRDSAVRSRQLTAWIARPVTALNYLVGIAQLILNSSTEWSALPHGTHTRTHTLERRMRGPKDGLETTEEWKVSSPYGNRFNVWPS